MFDLSALSWLINAMVCALCIIKLMLKYTAKALQINQPDRQKNPFVRLCFYQYYIIALPIATLGSNSRQNPPAASATLAAGGFVTILINHLFPLFLICRKSVVNQQAKLLRTQDSSGLDRLTLNFIDVT